MSGYSSTHYKVTWKTQWTETEIRTGSYTKNSLPEALSSRNRVLARNDYFVEVRGFTPYVFDVKVWKIETKTEWTEIDD